MLRLALLCVVTILAISVAAGIMLVSARDALAGGVREIHQAEAQLRGTTAGRSPGEVLNRTTLHVSRARADFERADTRLAPLGPFLRRLAWVPSIGSRLAASPTAAQLADQTANGALHLLYGLQPLGSIWKNHGAGNRPALSALVQRLILGRAEFNHACSLLADAGRTRHELEQYRSDGLSSGLAAFDRRVPRLLGLCKGLTVLPGLMGYGKAHTYLIAYQDENELRATGGFIGSVALLNVRNGLITQRFQGTGFERENYTIPSPQPVQIYNIEPYWLLRDSNWSPDFPTSAALERYFLNLDLHRDVQGVVDVTTPAAVDFLTATGPLYSPEYRRWITAANVSLLADYYAHWSPVPGPLALSSPDTKRKQFIQIVAQHVFDRLRDLPLSAWLQLGNSLAGGIAHRDILLHFADPRAQSFVRSVGADGAIIHTTADYLYVVDTNLSYNKINPYIHLRTGYRARIRPDRWLDANLTLRYTNVGAPRQLTSQGLGPGAGRLGGPLDYADFVRVYAPLGAQLVDQSGWAQPWSPGPAYGKTLFSGYLIVRHGASRTIHLHYVVPPNVFSWSAGARYRLLVQHQAGSHPDSQTMSVSYEGQTVSWTVNHPVLDWTRTVSIPRRPFHPIPLQAPVLPVVAPGHWIEPHAYLAAPR